MSPQLKRQISIVLAVIIVIAGWWLNGHKGSQSPEPKAQPQTQTQSQSSGQSDITVDGGISGGGKQSSPSSKPQTVPAGLPLGSGFDFYVVSLSWSPTWCAGNPDADNTQQCSRRMGLVMHGFWPQNINGYPADCPSSEPDRIPDSLARSYLDLIPSVGLMGHEWRKHGTCSGLSQKDYFATARAARERIAVPQTLQASDAPSSVTVNALEQDLVRNNPGLNARSVSITCKGQMLEEVRICMTKDLQFRDCGNVERSSCRLNTISIPTP